jgi:hypothetical protein
VIFNLKNNAANWWNVYKNINYLVTFGTHGVARELRRSGVREMVSAFTRQTRHGVPLIAVTPAEKAAEG